ncbi:hypothetical protein D3C74_426280 [compost metagenome]
MELERETDALAHRGERDAVDVVDGLDVRELGQHGPVCGREGLVPGGRQVGHAVVVTREAHGRGCERVQVGDRQHVRVGDRVDRRGRAGGPGGGGAGLGRRGG